MAKVIGKLNDALEYIENQDVNPWKEVMGSYDRIFGLYMEIYEEHLAYKDSNDQM